VTAKFFESAFRDRALVLFVLLGSQPLAAASLQVQPVGSASPLGVRIDLENTCEFELHTGPLLPGEYGACSSLASDADLVSGDTAFKAGDRIILKEGS
jgi:hypothetical protein